MLMRHGETAMAGLFCGHSDPPLNHAGRLQIELAASMLTEIPDVVCTSDLKRAQESAALIAKHFSVPIHVRPGLREINFGEWEGLSWHQIEQRFTIDARTWMEQYPYGVIPSGEPYELFRQRVRQETAFLLAESERRPIVAVTHAGFIRTALTELYGVPQSEMQKRPPQYASVIPLQPLHLGAL